MRTYATLSLVAIFCYHVHHYLEVVYVLNEHETMSYMICKCYLLFSRELP
jgi:hypothetical protein